MSLEAILRRVIRHAALIVLSVGVFLALTSCGGTTTKSTSTTGVAVGGTTSGGTSSTGGASGGSSGGTTSSGGSGTSGGTGGSGGSGGTGGSGGSGGAGGSGGTGGSGGSGGSGSTPHVIQSFTAPERLGKGSSASPSVYADMAVDAHGNIDITTQSKPLDPDFTSLSVRISPGAKAVTANTSLGPGAYPQVAGDSSGNVYVAWTAADVSATGTFSYSRGVFSRSTDGGGSFPGPTPVFMSQGGSCDVLTACSPHMALDASGDIFVVWNSPFTSSASPGMMFLNRSTDGGKTFSAAMPLSDPAKKALAPHIAVSSTGKIDVIWQYDSNGQQCDSSSGFNSCGPCDIWFTQSTDAGKSFSAPVNVSKSSGCAGLDPLYFDEQQIQPDSGGNINIVWDDSISGVMFSRSTDGGSHFSAPTRVSTSQGIFPRIAVDGSGNINAVWQPANGSGFFFGRSTDGGATFSQPMALGGGKSANPFVGTDSNGDIDVAWLDTANVRFSQSFDGGKTFSTPVDVDSSKAIPNPIQPNSVVRMVVEPSGDVDLIIDGAEPAGTGASYIWFTRGSTSNLPPPPPSTS